MNTKIEITHLLGDENFVPYDLSNNCATLGADAGKLTWDASMQAAEAIPPLLDTEERRNAFRDFVIDSGGWSKDEVREWDEQHLNALLLQWIAGDIREAFGDVSFMDWDWDEYEKDENRLHRIYRGDDGQIYFSLSS